MSNFKKFKIAVQEQFKKLSEQDLFYVNVNKNTLWDAYLKSFPTGTNNVFRERAEYDCQACKRFIRTAGNAVAIIDGQIHTIWNIEIGGTYQIVADALNDLVKSRSIENIFVHDEKNVGIDFNIQTLKNDEVLTWHHFYFQLPDKFVMRKDVIGSYLSDTRANYDVLKRSLDEISLYAGETVLELIDQNSLYRGEEHKSIVNLFARLKKTFDELFSQEEKVNYCWLKSIELAGASKIRNTAIGTLLVDISNEKDLNEAVKSFESKVAPLNYKRTKSLVTPRMVKSALKKVEGWGIEQSLERRYALLEDITINNVLFADKCVQKKMKGSRTAEAFEELIQSAPDNPNKFKKVEEVTITKFVSDILPKADKLELFIENDHLSNFVSLIAPGHSKAPNIFKWDNGFSWAYNGGVTDSMKQIVKKHGGNVEGVLRFSIQWNDGDNNQNDFDAHCHEPNGNLIFFENKGQIHPSSGMLDVDIINPQGKVAVENITWEDADRMQEGAYRFLVHNYTHRGGATGFTAEIEYDGKIYSYCYDKELRQGEKVIVADIEFSRTNGIKLLHSLPNSQPSKNMWGLDTQRFHAVNSMMYSPNFWDGQKGIGNKHFFFMLEGCVNKMKSRGFFNEYLQERFRKERKVFEALGGKIKTPESTEQLSGLGFSSTQRNSVFCKVKGNFSRMIKINF